MDSLESRRLLATNTGFYFASIPPVSNQTPAGLAYALADLNKDGRPDLIRSTSVGANSTVVQFGVPGQFSPGAFFPGGTGVTKISTADVNKDGNVDIVLANGIEKTIQTLIGNGAGSFTSLQALALGNMSPLEFATADFNKDGNLDIVSTGFQDNDVYKGIVKTLTGSAAGTFSINQTFTPSVATNFTAPQGVATGDFNGDTWPDFVVMHQATQTGYQIYLNNQNGTFTQQAITPAMSTAVVPARVTTGDFNGDGKADFAFNAQSSSTFGSSFPSADLGVAISTGTGFNITYYALATDQDYLINQYANPLVADLDGDGLLDIAINGGTNSGAGRIGILRGAGNGTFTNARTIPSEATASALAAADITGDGRLDITASRPGNSTLDLYIASTTRIEWNTTPLAYTGQPQGPEANVLTIDFANLPVSYTYFSAAAPNTPIAKPVNVGNYIARADVAGDSTHPAATSTQAFTITKGTPTISILVDPAAQYTATPRLATATVQDASGGAVANPTITFTYYLQSDTAFANPLPGAPTNVGSYSVRASFAGSSNLNAGTAVAFFEITPAIPSVNVLVKRFNPYTGSPAPVTTTVTGLDGSVIGTASVRYHLPSDATFSSPLPQPPVNIGLYRIYAEFFGNANYGYMNTVSVFSIVSAEQLVVTTTNDLDAGNASPDLDGTSLREALRYASQLPGANTITFDPSLAGQTITLTGGDDSALTIPDAVTIQGPAGGITITVPTTASRRLIAVQSTGSLTVSNVTLTGGRGATGGAILNSGTLNVSNSTFSNNTVTGEGGAIFSTGSATITNSTFASNGSKAVVLASGSASLTNVTVAYNADAGVSVGTAAVTLRNSIVAGNTGADLVGTLASGSSNNLVNVSAASAGLGTLASNGGATQTIALNPGSPAINAGLSLVAADQRGIARPQGSASDIGAFERQLTSYQLTSGAFESLTRQAVTFNFTADASVGFGRSNITLVNLTTGTTFAGGTLQWNAAGTAASLVLTNLLPDGNCRATAGSTQVDFFVLAGDFNRDRRANFDDLLVLAANYNQSGKNNSQGDATYDGVVDFADLLKLAMNYNKALPAASLPAPVAAPGQGSGQSDFGVGDEDSNGNSVLA
jgi:predicted outer membrane repeat protein